MPVSVGHRRGGDSACARVVPDLSIYLLVLKVFYHPNPKIAIGPVLIPTQRLLVLARRSRCQGDMPGNISI